MFAGSKGRDAALPWGWWLRVVGSSIEDSQGRRWNSVRQAFWEGELQRCHDREEALLEHAEARALRVALQTQQRLRFVATAMQLEL